MFKNAHIVIPAYQPNFVLFDLVSSLIKISKENPNVNVRIIVVNDGSTNPEAQNTFLKIAASFKDVTILNHKINLGKGTALKTAFTFIKENFDGDEWVVTADADGQHLSKDIWKLIEAGLSSKEPVIGVRAFGINVPLRSKIGNTATRFLFKLIYKSQVSDTQSGLRGFHYDEISPLLKLTSKGYAFELDALIHFFKNSNLREVPIETVYEPGNPTSHFRPLLDSAAIYAVLFRQILASGMALILEILLFLSLSSSGVATYLALPLARVIAGLALFSVIRNFVFKSDGKLVLQVFKFITLVIANLTVSVMIIDFVEHSLGKNKLVGLFFSYALMFLINFLIQKNLIFNRS